MIERVCWLFVRSTSGNLSAEIFSLKSDYILLTYLVVVTCLSKHTTQYHRLRGSGSTVVTMTSKVNGKMEISTPCRSETPQNIKTKFGLNDYVMDPYQRANFR